MECALSKSGANFARLRLTTHVANHDELWFAYTPTDGVTALVADEAVAPSCNREGQLERDYGLFHVC